MPQQAQIKCGDSCVLVVKGQEKWCINHGTVDVNGRQAHDFVYEPPEFKRNRYSPMFIYNIYNAWPNWTEEEIGKMLGISTMAVCRALKRAAVEIMDVPKPPQRWPMEMFI